MTRHPKLPLGLAALACALLLAVPAFAQSDAVATASVASSTGWLAGIAGLFGTVLTVGGGWLSLLHIKNQRVILVVGALERAAGYGLAQAQKQGLTMTSISTWDVMAREAAGYMLTTYGDTLRKLGVTEGAQLGQMVTGALGKLLGPVAAPMVLGTATTLLDGASGSTATDLTDAAVDAVASAVTSKLPAAQVDLDALADHVIAKLPAGLQVVAQQGKLLADASMADLIAALKAQPAADPTPPAAVAVLPAAPSPELAADLTAAGLTPVIVPVPAAQPAAA